MNRFEVMRNRVLHACYKGEGGNLFILQLAYTTSNKV
jgi:hypothetical protein